MMFTNKERKEIQRKISRIKKTFTQLDEIRDGKIILRSNNNPIAKMMVVDSEYPPLRYVYKWTFDRFCQDCL